MGCGWGALEGVTWVSCGMFAGRGVWLIFYVVLAQNDREVEC